MKLAQTVQRLWLKLIAPSAPEVILHDPAAEGPHDLDDPFFDQKVRERTARIIANAARK
jgi:hypothetical protein